MNESTPIFDRLAAETLALSLPLYDAIAAAAVPDVVAGFEVLLTWAAGDQS